MATNRIRSLACVGAVGLAASLLGCGSNESPKTVVAGAEVESTAATPWLVIAGARTTFDGAQLEDSQEVARGELAYLARPTSVDVEDVQYQLFSADDGGVIVVEHVSDVDVSAVGEGVTGRSLAEGNGLLAYGGSNAEQLAVLDAVARDGDAAASGYSLEAEMKHREVRLLYTVPYQTASGLVRLGVFAAPPAYARLLASQSAETELVEVGTVSVAISKIKGATMASWSREPGLVVTLDLGPEVGRDDIVKLVSYVKPTTEQEWIGAMRHD